MLLPPAVAEGEPPQLFVNPLGVATTSPEGSVSVKATPVSETELAAGLVRVKVRLVIPPSRTLEAPNALLMVGGATTARLAEAVLPVPPSVEVTFPVVLFLAPAVVPVTFRLKVQEALDAKLAPDKLIAPLPALAVIVPPQLLLSPLGVEITRPAGSVSLKPIPVSVVVTLLF